MNSISESRTYLCQLLRYKRTQRMFSTVSPERIKSALKYCKDVVRQRDYEGYLSVPFFPSHLRDTQYAI
ncbi:hypothetical protein BDF20DRAFT_891249, partial [Mycotypha africana]|uniref:uncharacterized protein n=1 Tax=Mycotypha africana TaxID=64632 RepID=UPI0023004F0A